MSDPIYEAQAYEIAKMARSIRTLESENAKLRVLTSCAYGIVDEFMKLNGCPYYDNGMSCSLSDECEETSCAEHPDCLLDVLAKTLRIEVDG